MIILFSTKEDFSTKEVCDWLQYFGQEYRVISSNDLLNEVNIFELSEHEIVDYLEHVFTVKLREIKVFWCRKWDLLSYNQNVEFGKDLPDETVFKLRMVMYNDRRSMCEFLFRFLPQDRIINSFFKNQYKLNQLLTAKEVGLIIPKTYILSDYEKLENLIKSGKSFITKPLTDGFGLTIGNESFSTLTSRIDLLQVNTKTFFPSLIQEEVEKDFEVRTFILGRRTYSIAIFSQENSQTEVDFRQYDAVNPNKIALFQLPVVIETKILKFCEAMGFETGSVDFIVNKEGEFYFLEINPYGQFGMVSKPANLNLEKEIANYLMKYERSN